ncbi:hypothetical protein [Halolamina salina]|uniref:Uncharacterized protein n=1 Tax=Halolamina salina TaxID=1220023 RepID=A0ABD6B983_9EURY
MNDSETALAVRMTEKALHRDVTGKRHMPVEGIVCVVAVHNRGQAKEVLEEMVRNHTAGWARMKPETYHISDEDAAVEFLEENGGNIPFRYNHDVK